MKYLHLNTKVLTFILFFLLLLPSCNNEEIFVIEESAIIAEETEPTEEETPNTEDEAPPIVPVDLVDDTVNTMENTSVDIEAYLNDINLPQSIIVSNTNPSNGVLTINSNETPDNVLDDTVVYTPNAGFSGVDSFEYTICDATNSENCDTAIVTITIEEDFTDITDEFDPELKAFPSAYGGGAQATGGRGGNVYHVTNLNDSGTGSLRNVLGKPRPAIIVFDVSGIIDIQSWLQITGTDLTIAGQTAPVGGITITSSNGSRFRFREASNIIIRYIRIRPFESGNDAFEIFPNDTAHDIILDHVSTSYGGDEAMSIRGSETHNITFQRCLIAESKTGSLFGDSSEPANSYDNSMLNCLFWNVSHRHPNAGSNGRVDVINNVIQNWQYRLVKTNGDIKLNHINNYHAMGSRTSLNGGSQIQLNAVNSSRNNAIFTAGNIIDKNMFVDPSADNTALWVEFEEGKQTTFAPSSEFVSTQYPLIGVPLPIKTAVNAYADVITNVGANASLNADGTVSDSRDINDVDYLTVMEKGEGSYESYTMKSNIRSWFGEKRYADFVASVSSSPINIRPTGYDSDNDGMPDIWEAKIFDDLSQNSDGDHDGDGYTNIEEFINMVDK